MDGELMNYVQGYAKPARHDRQVVAKARAIRHEVQLAAFKAQGSAALGSEVMKLTAKLYDEHKELGKDDPAKEMLVNGTMMRAVGKMWSVQEELYDGWRL